MVVVMMMMMVLMVLLLLLMMMLMLSRNDTLSSNPAVQWPVRGTAYHLCQDSPPSPHCWAAGVTMAMTGAVPAHPAEGMAGPGPLGAMSAEITMGKGISL